MDAFVDEAVAADPRAGRATARVVCGALGRRRLVGRRGARAPRDRRPAAPASSSTTACCARASARRSSALFRERARHPRSSTVDASERFLGALARRRRIPRRSARIIGHLFIEVFEEEAAKLGDADFLVQGTLYPDVIESVSVRGPSATIKTHHNVGGLPERMKLALVEPLRELFKDEVRAVGRAARAARARCSGAIRSRGRASRSACLGEVTRGAARDRCARADAILIEEIRARGPLRRRSGRPSPCSCRSRASA